MNSTEVNQLIEGLSVTIDPSTFIEEVSQMELPPVVSEFAGRYEEEIDTRNPFVWKWLYKGFTNHYTLETVSDEHAEELYTVKTLLTMFIAILDDLAEEDNDRETFERARTIPFSTEPTTSPSGVNQPALTLASDIWSMVSNRLAGLPRYQEFIILFIYDFRQVITAMDYSLLVNESPAVATRTGTQRYGPLNMSFFPYLDIDLMASPNLIWADIAPLRELYWTGQQMGGIGNWVTTWQREIYEEDFSSGVVVWALRDGVVTVEQLRADPEAAIEAIEATSIEEMFINQWHTLHTDLTDPDETATSVDLSRVADRIERLLAFQLAAKGYK